MNKPVQIIPKTYDFILWIIEKINKFPRSQKFVLGDRIEHYLLDILDMLIEAQYSKEKVAILRLANLKLEKIRYLIRISKDLRYIDLKAYEFSASSVNEIGKMLGGWLKSLNV
ncbi:MAG: diversity-generating retroelement protein Avd [Elusimicrobiota bacterium]